jgi:hypothetical protein
MPEKPSKLMPALYGGIIIGLLSGIPYVGLVNCLCCAGIMIGGFLAVFFYKKDLPPDAPPLTNSDALALGALAGLFGALFFNVIDAGFLYTIGNVSAEMMRSVYDKMGVLEKMPSEALEKLDNEIANPALSLTTVLTWFVIGPLFGLLGGLIGYAVFKPKLEVKPPEFPPLPPIEMKG